MAIWVEEYLAEDGKNHFKVATARSRMMAGSLGNIKPIDGTLREFRIDWGPGIRIYLVQDSDKLIVLLGGGTKNGQKADIKRAGELRDEYFARKSGAMNLNSAVQSADYAD